MEDRFKRAYFSPDLSFAAANTEGESRKDASVAVLASAGEPLLLNAD